MSLLPHSGKKGGSKLTLGEVTTLQHEVGDDTMERAPFVSISVLAGSELTEVPGRLGNNLVVEPEDDATGGLAVDGDIKLHVFQIPIARWRWEVRPGPFDKASVHTKTLDILVLAVCVKKGETTRSENSFGR